MPTELEELVEFLHHGNTQIRQIAAENLLPYSQAQPTIFKTAQLAPVKDLKLLVKDYAPIAKNTLTILINISGDEEVLRSLAEDDGFVETLLARVTNPKEPNADPICMLLANLAKHPSITRLVALTRSVVPALSPSNRAVTQLLECFNKGAGGGYNKDANFDYLAWFFGDLAKDPAFTTYLTTPPPHSPLDPLTLFLPHTDPSSRHSTPTRRLGTASLLKNTALIHPSPLYLLQPAHSVLPALLLPLCPPNNHLGLSEQEMDSLPDECQYLGEEHVQESDKRVLEVLLETLFLLVSKGGGEGVGVVKGGGTYAVVREVHLGVEDEGVRGWCERVVDVLMMEGEGGVRGDGEAAGVEKTDGNANGDKRVVTWGADVDDGDDEDEEIVPIF